MSGAGSSAIAASVRALLAKYAGESHYSGVCLIRQGDRDIVHEATGLAHRGFGVPNTIDTRFDIASVTKIFTAAAIMQLVDDDQISLETRIMPYLGMPDTAISDDVTVFHALTHTSGIGDDADEEAGEDYELLFVDRPNYSIRETRDFLPQFVHKDPVFAPGQGVRYNNVAFVLLGLVIERATGVSYRDYVKTHIFERAGMTGADFCAMDGTCANFAEHYKLVEHENGAIEWRKNIYSYPPIGSPDGGATVTAHDLDRFIRAAEANRLMSEDATRQLLTPHVKVTDTESGSIWNGFAFEFVLDNDARVVKISKEGNNAGVSSVFAWFPSRETTCVILANQDCDVWTMLREIEPLIEQLPTTGEAAAPTG